MKYACEKCMKVYETEEECKKHESNHICVDGIVEYCTKLQKELLKDEVNWDSVWTEIDIVQKMIDLIVDDATEHLDLEG